MGIDLGFTPVLDLESEELRPGGLLRSFGSDPVLVGTMGAEMIRGLREGGVLAAARSFPGKGESAARPGLPPLVMTPRKTILERDLSPFRRAITEGVPLVMTSNAVYPSIDPDQPAMFSPKIVAGLLRRDLGFGGVAVTEDLTARSVLASRAADEAAVTALLAGNDLCLLAHDYENVKRAARGIRSAVQGGRLKRGPYEESQLRLQGRLARNRPGLPLPGEDPEEHEAAAALAGIVAESAVRIERDPHHLVPLEPGRRVGILVPRLWDVADRIAIDAELRGADSVSTGWVRSHAPGVQVVAIPVGQRTLFEELQRTSAKVIAVLIGNPWDRAFATEGTAIMNTHGFRICQLSAAVRVLFGKAAAKS
jgi:beta-N-acetylhexosaminidase